MDWSELNELLFADSWNEDLAPLLRHVRKRWLARYYAPRR
jgi:hypothetical protein